jgi:hypothetical protein
VHLLRESHWDYERVNALQTAAWIALSGNQSAKALDLMRQALDQSQDFPVRPEGFEYTYVCALWANGIEETADDFLEKAYQRVMSVANQINDQALRGSWLENVYRNRQIIQDWVLNRS